MFIVWDWFWQGSLSLFIMEMIDWSYGEEEKFSSFSSISGCLVLLFQTVCLLFIYNICTPPPQSGNYKSIDILHDGGCCDYEVIKRFMFSTTENPEMHGT